MKYYCGVCHSHRAIEKQRRISRTKKCPVCGHKMVLDVKDRETK